MRYFTLLLICLNGLFSKSQVFNWVHTSTDPNTQIGKTLAVDTNDNVYACGTFDGTVDFDFSQGTFALTTIGNYDIYITKYNSSGSLVWAKQIGGSQYEEIFSIKLDNSGNILIAGTYYSSTIDFDPGPGVFNMSAAASACFVLKLDPLGNFVWAKQITGNSSFSNWNLSYKMALDNIGNIILTGGMSGTGDFDIGSGTYNLTATQDAFLAKYDSNGNLFWAFTIGGSWGDCDAKSVCTDGSGNIYLTGAIASGTIDLDPTPAVNNLSGKHYLAKYDPNGNLIWTNQYNNGPSVGITNIKIDHQDNLYTAGYFNALSDFDLGSGTNLLTPANYDGYISKMDTAGNLIWVKTFPGLSSVGSVNCADFAIDQGLNIYVVGNFSNNASIPPNTFYSYYVDVFIAKLDVSGNYLWSKHFDSPNASTKDDFMNSVGVTSSGSIYTTGEFTDILDFDTEGGVYNVQAQNKDFFIHKLTQDTCFYLSFSIDSVSNLTCFSPGYAAAHTINAKPPYSYMWNTNPPVNDSNAYFTSGDIHNLTLTDANNCQLAKNVLIMGPDTSISNDLNIHLTGTSFRPGFPSLINVIASNNDCTPINGSLKLKLDSQLTVSSINPVPDTIFGNTLTWNFNSLHWDNNSFSANVEVVTSVNAIIGDSVILIGTVLPILSDSDATNNKKTIKYPVVNGYDPNDKQVYPQGVCPEHYILNNQKLTYTVRFQNTGNSNAININVLDSLDSDLDLNSVRVIANSHPLITEVLPGNVLKFRFDNILLPDSGSNEPASHGYVIYEVDPLPSLPNGTEIRNHADIYFDFNPPVITNTVFNTIIDSIPACNIITGTIIKNESGFKIYPNPAKDFFRIENVTPGSTINLYDISGRLIKSQKNNTPDCIVNTESLQNGIFLVEISDETSKTYKRIVISK